MHDLSRFIAERFTRFPFLFYESGDDLCDKNSSKRSFCVVILESIVKRGHEQFPYARYVVDIVDEQSLGLRGINCWGNQWYDRSMKSFHCTNSEFKMKPFICIIQFASQIPNSPVSIKTLQSSVCCCAMEMENVIDEFITIFHLLNVHFQSHLDHYKARSSGIMNKLDSFSNRTFWTRAKYN